MWPPLFLSLHIQGPLFLSLLLSNKPQKDEISQVSELEAHSIIDKCGGAHIREGSATDTGKNIRRLARSCGVWMPVLSCEDGVDLSLGCWREEPSLVVCMYNRMTDK